METITIQWDTGCMTLYPDAFFPTSTDRVRRLLRTVDLDRRHRDQLKEELARYCTHRAEALLEGRRALAAAAVAHHQQAADLQAEIHRRTKAAGSAGPAEKRRAEREALKQLKARQRSEQAAFRQAQRQLARAEKDAGRLRKNAEVIGA